MLRPPISKRNRRMTRSSDFIRRPTKHRRAPSNLRTEIDKKLGRDIESTMIAMLADVFALYWKTRHFHLRLSGSHCRDYPIAQHNRKVRGTTPKAIRQIGRPQRPIDIDASDIDPVAMLAELREDNTALALRLREAHDVCERYRHIAMANLIEVWIEETERRRVFLFKLAR